MLRIDTGCRIDLKGVVVVGGVFEETVKGIEHFVGQKEEELSKKVKDGADLYFTNTKNTNLDTPP